MAFSNYQTECCNILGGIVHIGLYRPPVFVGVGAAARPVYPYENRDLGEVSKAMISQDIDTKERSSHRSAAGGLACSNSTIKKASLDLTVDCTSASNRAMAMLGLLKDIPAGPVTNEPVIVVRNPAGAGRTLVPLEFLLDDTQPVVVTSVGGATTYVAGVDYLIEAGNLYVLDTGSIPVLIVYGVPNIEVDYTRRKQQQIESSLKTSGIYTLSFAGYSSVGGTVSPHQAGVRYAKIQPTNVDLITDDFDQFNFKFDLLPDPALVMSTAYSPYFWGFFAAR